MNATSTLWMEIWKGVKQMKRSIKRALAIMLSILLMTSNLGLTAFAEEFTSGSDKSYSERECSLDILSGNRTINIERERCCR